MAWLSQDKALIFRITHIDNVLWILRNGLCCRNGNIRDPNFREIGNPELIEKRAHRKVPIGPGGTLSDYIPFYFTPHSPMLYNIKTGYGGVSKLSMGEIAVLVSSLFHVANTESAFVFTDRHAYLAAAQFYDDLNALSNVDWKLLNQRDFKRDHNDPEKLERYQAEALVHKEVPVHVIQAIACCGIKQKAMLDTMVRQTSTSVRVVKRPEWYF